MPVEIERHIYTDGVHFTVSATMRNARLIAVRAVRAGKTGCEVVAPLDDWRRVPDGQRFRIYHDISDNVHETHAASKWASWGSRYLTESE